MLHLLKQALITSLNLQSPESATLILVVLNVWLIRDEYLSYLVIEKYIYFYLVIFTVVARLA